MLMRKLILPAIGLSVAGLVLSRTEPKATMHEDDWEDGGLPARGRRFRSLPQVFHHLGELTTMNLLLPRIYLLRALDPVLREQIMILTALADGCPL